MMQWCSVKSGEERQIFFYYGFWILSVYVLRDLYYIESLLSAVYCYSWSPMETLNMHAYDTTGLYTSAIL